MLQLEYVRNQLSSAMLGIIIDSDEKAESRIFADKRNASVYAKPQREISIDGRVIRVDATPVHCSETRAYKGGRVLIKNIEYTLAAWRRIVSRLPQSYSAWIQYSYGDSTSWECQIILSQHVWSAFLIQQKAAGSARMSKKVASAMQQLTWLAIQDTKRLINTRVSSYTSADLARLTGVAPDNWTHNYQPRWNVLKQIVAGLDREALIHAEHEHRTARSRNRDAALPV
ncbi:bacteriophage antitermination protein Q [Pectobacterium brasiliense]|uniref:bacteriophage antitermination protein Q n=1 Tax=Pectobacterium brasiliense TaxID=180957 RepID=UPI000B962FC8|nr:bacteriophage antitermination protein Q [Pectobacterium carotovorum]OYN53228.1 hypothetical protein B7L51_01135 [Pectobacterium carotovorum]